MAYNKYKFLKSVPKRFMMPDSPEEWKDTEFTLFRKFRLNHVDYQILLDLIKEKEKYAKGNSKYTWARILEIVYSQYWDANTRFWLQHKHPNSWMIIYGYKRLRTFLQWVFKTKHYRNQLILCDISKDITKDLTLSK